jgi:predicted permease
MESFFEDIRHGLRTLLKNPAFTLVAILTLALGIGANTAMFSLTDQVLLRMLPVQKPQELVVLTSPGIKPGHVWSDTDDGPSFSYPEYKDLRDRNQVFSGLLARYVTEVNISGQGDSQLANAELVSGNYFDVLGVTSSIGRVFGPGDETAKSANPVAVLSHGFWARHFGSNTQILNKQILVNGTSFTVVGVAQAGFNGVQVGQSPDLFVPITMKPQMTPNRDGLDTRRDYWVALIGRLKPGMTIERAESGLLPTFHAMLEEDAPSLKLTGTKKQQYIDQKIYLKPGSHGRPTLQADYRQPLLILMGMVALVLLIACANLASLLVARSEARQREIALRQVMGAGRGRLVRQLMTESLLLSTIGGIAGIVVASWTLGAIVSAIPESIGANGLKPQLDDRVLIFAVALSVVTGILFGLAPAIRATRESLQTTLKDQGVGVTGGRGDVRLRKVLMVGQVALTAVLLAGAGFFAHSLMNLKGQEIGVRTEHAIEFSVSPELNGYTPTRTAQLVDRMRQTIAALPGVRAVSYAEIPVLSNSNSTTNITVEGYNAQEGESTDVEVNSMGPNYLAAVGTPLIRGRDIAESDVATSQKVAVINEAMERRFFAGRDPIGQHFGWGQGDGIKVDVEIVGIMKNSKSVDLRQTIVPFVITPYTQNEHVGSATFYVRTNQDPLALATSLRSTVRNIDSSLPMYDLKTLRSQVDEIVFTDRLVTIFSLCLGALASLLAALGLYGVMAYVVARRTREIGIRMALGATQHNVSWMILREIVGMSAAGLTFGLIAAYALGRVVETQLFGVKASDPLVFLVAALLLGSVAMMAGWLPARKAAGVDPMIALRYD